MQKRALVSFVAFLLALPAALPAHGAVYAPSAREVQFSYTAEFSLKRPPRDAAETQRWAQLHAAHLFGILASPTLTKRLGINPDKIHGFGAPRFPQPAQILSTRTEGSETIVTYHLNGYLLLQRWIAQSFLQQGEVTLPMPYELSDYYDKNCTDPVFYEASDFYYFYDPFRKGCEHMITPPEARDVKIELRATPEPTGQTLDAKLNLLRGDNGNGSAFRIYVIHGFNESSKKRGDEGRKGFKDLMAYFKSRGFSIQMLRNDPLRPLALYRREIQGRYGTIQVEVRHLLANTDLDGKTVTFARFFKEAVENGDVIVYSGHSGLGASLNMAELKKLAGGFTFDPNKRQIFFFEACSSYSYYMSSFESQAARERIDIVSNGLESYFYTGTAVFTAFFDSILDMNQPTLGWDQILKSMEAPLKGSSYLLNVGAL